MSQVWVIRAGRDGKDQNYALENECAVIGWHWVGDIRAYKGDLEKIKTRIRKEEPGSSNQSIGSAASQLLNLVKGVKKGDLIIVPLKGGTRNHHSAIGEVVGPYRFRKSAPAGCKHQRPVKWLKEAFPNSGADILGALTNWRSTVNKIGDSKECANLLRALKGGGQSLGSTASDHEVKQAIGRKFPAKQMEELVRQILNAMGYECEEPASKGADGGLDVFATHPDKNGLVDPLCAQVKNTNGIMGAPDMQKLAGAMSEACVRDKGFKGPFHKGLFVSFGGFGDKAKAKDLAQRFPHIRQWTADDILRLAREYCDRIDCANCKKRLAECGISAARSVQ